MALSLNMEVKLSPELRQLALRVGIGVALLAVAVYLLAVMPLLEGRRLEREIAEEQARIERQLRLMPTLASLGQDAKNATLEELLPPKTEPMPRAQAYLVTEQLSHMAVALGLEALDVSLDPASMATDPNSIQVQGVFAGELASVRAFLLDLNQLPSLARVEKVELRAVDGRLEMMVQLRIALGA